MTNELTVRVEHPELPAIRWNEAEVQQNLTEMLEIGRASCRERV